MTNHKEQKGESRMKLTDYQIGLISHPLGINYYHAVRTDDYREKELPDKFYRNYYNYDTLTEDMVFLESNGLIEFGATNYFHVTESGIELFRKIFKEEVTDKYIKPSRSKQRYMDYLHADSSLTFAEWIGVKLKQP